MTTIKEVADRCRVTKPTVKRRLVELGLWEKHVNKTGASYEIDDYAAAAVADSLTELTERSIADEEPSADTLALDAVTKAMSAHISSLEAQLEAKDRTIDSLIEQNGKLSGRVGELSDRLADLSARVTEYAETTRKRSLFDRLLGAGGSQTD